MRKLIITASAFLLTMMVNAQQDSYEVSNLIELKEFLSQKTHANEFSGVVLIAKDGKPIFEEAYGYSSKRFDIKNNTDTKFNIGSLSKHFTSIAILQLAEKGLLNLNDTIGKYLDYFPKEISGKVTVMQLINMKSGWGDYWDNAYYVSYRYNLRSVSDYMKFIKDMPLEFENGSEGNHSNTGFEVAGAIIEKITEMNYFDYIRENIYAPAGMLNTDSYDIDNESIKNLAVGYTNEHPCDTVKRIYDWSNTYLRLPAKGSPTGGSYSTAEDLLKFDQAIRSFKLLNEDYTTFLLNLFIGSVGDPFMMNKGILHYLGGAEGVGAVYGQDLMNKDFSKGYTIVVLTNYDFQNAIDVYEVVKNFVYKLKEQEGK
ncbi:MAG TPA: hypothetical protein DEA97_12265 [Bacteroidales bacterium]|nr:MAG: Beta-lactamase [candidate division TM6 bacterium GW2011_GWF2_33_332]HBS87326.1 hypothetical protein [Bacteroidales bacterium]